LSKRCESDKRGKSSEQQILLSRSSLSQRFDNRFFSLSPLGSESHVSDICQLQRLPLSHRFDNGRVRFICSVCRFRSVLTTTAGVVKPLRNRLIYRICRVRNVLTTAAGVVKPL